MITNLNYLDLRNHCRLGKDISCVFFKPLSYIFLKAHCKTGKSFPCPFRVVLYPRHPVLGATCSGTKCYDVISALLQLLVAILWKPFCIVTCTGIHTWIHL